MRKLTHNVKMAWKATDPEFRAAIFAAFAMLSIMALAFLLGGCSTTSSGLSKEQKLYQVGTNVTSVLSAVGQTLPHHSVAFSRGSAPLQRPSSPGGSAGQHTQIKALQSGSGAAASATAPAAGERALGCHRLWPIRWV